MSGITSHPVAEAPIAVVDVETTGLHPGGDRIVEIAVARLEPGESRPAVVLDTLVNPNRRVSATEIHGITDDDVRDAPTFEEVAPAVAAALEDAVFAAYNVYFDVKFLTSEFERAGIATFPPYLCLMYMRPLLDLGKRCSLNDACREHGIEYEDAHVAAADALASAYLWPRYVERMHDLGIQTFGDLAARKRYKFVRSFRESPLRTAPRRVNARVKSRWSRPASTAAPSGASERDRCAEYWNALKAALADLEITDAEIEYLTDKRRRLQLTDSEVRSLHARAFAGILAEVTDDHLIDEREVGKVAMMADALRRLGWSPGDRLTPVHARGEWSPAPRRGLFARLFRA